MKYTVEDHEDADRDDVLVGTFETLEEAGAYAREWSASYGHCTIHDEDGDKVMTIDVNAEDDEETAKRAGFDGEGYVVEN